MMPESIVYLNWDTHFFGKRVGSLCLLATHSLTAGLQSAKCQGFELVYIDSEREILQSRSGAYLLVDTGGKTKFVKTLDRYSKQVEDNPCIKLYDKHDIDPEIIALAYLSGHRSRFKLDPCLPPGSFERLYRAWLTNNLHQMPMAAIYTYQVSGTIVGLITSQWHEATCSIGLLAVLPSWQGQGIGMQLLKQVESLCVANSISRLEVQTQLSNTSAQALYRKNLFIEAESRFLYHAHRIAAWQPEKATCRDSESCISAEV